MIDQSDIESLRGVLAHPAIERICAALAGDPAYLVGGAVRDPLLGVEPRELDVAVDGPLEPLLDRLGEPARNHDRFATAAVVIEGVEVDLARCRRERYPEPGALPEVEPAPIRTDLARRDFTVAAMAVPLGPAGSAAAPELIDPYDGLRDLRAGLLRVIHPGSFRDDPTRALRAARYCARLGFALEDETERLLRAGDLATVSDDRVAAELRRIAAEPQAAAGFRLLDDWGLLAIGERRLGLLEEGAALPRAAPWDGELSAEELLPWLARLTAPELEAGERLAGTDPARPSEAVAAARGAGGLELALARLLGAEWVDSYLSDWREVRLRIGGGDLLAAGIEPGPALGAGLEAALRARLDGEIANDRDAELAVALAAARAAG